MSDGITDDFPFSNQSYSLTEKEKDNLILKLIKLHYAKDVKIKKMEGLLKEIKEWYSLPSSTMAGRIDEVLK